MQGKGSNPPKVLIKENKVIYQSINQLNSGWCHTVIKFQLYIYIYIERDRAKVEILRITVNPPVNGDTQCVLHQDW